jgi:hypothetical protein
MNIDIDIMPANGDSVRELCQQLAEMVTNIFPESWQPKVSFRAVDNPLKNLLAGEYAFRITCKAPSPK